MQRFKNFAISLVVVALLVFPLTTSSHNQEPPRKAPAKFMKAERPIPNRYIVVLEDDVAPDNLPIEVRRERVAAIANGHAQSHGGKVDFIYETALKGYAIELPNDAAARAISNSPQVRWVEEDSIGEWAQAPASPQPSPPWGLDSLDSGIPAPSPDPTTGLTSGSYGFNANGTGVTAYVLDSGINTQHTQFMTPFVSRASIAANCFEFVNCVSGTQTAFFNQQVCASGLPSPSNNDCYGHGTHVAGTIGGNTYGVAKNVNLRSVKVGSTFGPVSSAVIAGVNWMTADHQASPSTPVVANMSIEVATGAVESTVQNAINQGITVVAAAGNGNTNANSVSPANVADALTVGAVDWNGVRSPVSNWGPLVDLFAPGVQIASAASGGGICPIGTFCLLSGTSHAAPHVTGAVAQYLQGRPGQVNCNVNPIQGGSPFSGNRSACPDRVSRFIIATARMNVLSGVSSTPLPSANRYLATNALPGPTNPIENNQFFVWSQYIDFLNREPDSVGFSNWVSNLNSCGGTWPCINNERIHAVRGMIESTEFRTGKPALSNPSSTNEYNTEYVRQLYLCLLHREPDSGGWATYVSELNSTGDYDHTVHGFINGSEYRFRFGPN